MFGNGRHDQRIQELERRCASLEDRVRSLEKTRSQMIGQMHALYRHLGIRITETQEPRWQVVNIIATEKEGGSDA